MVVGFLKSIHLIEKSAAKHLDGTRFFLRVCVYVYIYTKVVRICRYLAVKKDCSHAESVNWSFLQSKQDVRKARN